MDSGGLIPCHGGSMTRPAARYTVRKDDRGWRLGVAELQRACRYGAARSGASRSERTCDSPRQQALISNQSSANQRRFVLGRDAFAKLSTTPSPEERQRLRAEIKRYLESEIVLVRQLFMLVRKD